VRVALLALLSLLSLPFIAAALLLIPAVQSYVVQKAVDYGSDYLKAELVLDGFYLEPFKTVRLNGVLIRDQQEDTLLYVDVLKVDVTRWSIDSGYVNIDEVELRKPYFNLYIQEGDTVTNMQFLLDAFASDASDTSKVKIKLDCDELILDDLRFAFHDRNSEFTLSNTIDFKHLEVSHLSGRISDISFQDSVKAQLHGLHFQEQSGFRLRNLNTRAVVGPNSIICRDMQLVLNLSVVEGDYAMYFDDFGSFSNVFDSVHMKADLTNARVHFYDIGFFHEPSRNMLTPLEFEGRAWGTINYLHASVQSLSFGDHGFLMGDMTLRGLPDPDEFYVNADITRLSLKTSDIEMLRIPTSNGLQLLDLPESVNRLGQVGFQGELRGYIKNFDTNGNLTTDLGELDLDVNLRPTDVFAYRGEVFTSSFDLGGLLDDDNLGIIATDIEVSGSGTDVKTMEVEAVGKVNRFEWSGYAYQMITVDGSFIDQIFEGNLSMDDPNADFDFTGSIDFEPRVPTINCVSRVTQLRIGRLGLVPQDTFGVVSGIIDLQMEGLSKEELHGSLLATQLSYVSKDQQLELDTLSLTDDLVEGGHDIRLESDVVTAIVKGRTNLFDLPLAIQSVLQPYAPTLVGEVKRADLDTTQQFDFDLRVHDVRKIEEFINPDFRLANTLHAFGTVRTADEYVELNLDTVSWRLGSLAAHRQVARILPSKRGLSIEVGLHHLHLSDDFFLEDVTTRSLLYNDSLESSISWDNRTSRSDSGTVEILAYRSEAYALNVELRKFFAKIAEATWTSTKTAVLRVDSGDVEVRQLDIQSKIGRVVCDGVVTNQKDAKLNFDVRGFDLNYLNRFGLVENDIEGQFNGTVNVYRLHEALVAESDLVIDSLTIDEFEIGSISGESKYKGERKAVDVSLELSYKDMRNVKVVGEYFPLRETDQLDLEVALNQFRASIIEPFVQNYAQNLEGAINGSVSISGKITEPVLTGALSLTDGSVEVEYLKTSYSIPKARVSIYGDWITADQVKVYDSKGSLALLNASVIHENFREMNYDISLEATNFLALNTTVADNDAYCGVANITGDVTVSGVPGTTNISVDAFTNKNTRLSIPLDEGDEMGQIDYIRFVSPDQKNRKKVSQSVNLEEEGAILNLDFQLAVNDNAEIQIIFDEKIGDVIKVRGEGDMLMRIDNRGTFNMYGDYTMAGGDYLFTLQNIVNKRFMVQPGSKISWTGDPLSAIVDLTAIYNTRAAPINLTSSVGDTSEVYRRRLPVDVYLMMDGKLLEPDITFDVNLPSLPETDIANQLLDPRTTSQQDMNEQAFALLLTNSFFAQGSGVSALGVAGQTTTYEMMSNQFSNWVSQYFDNVDIGVNYRPGDNMAGNQTEVNLSTELFNDRVLVEVNGRVQGNNTSTEDANEVMGEFNVEYRINEAMRARVFNEANNYNPANINQSPYTQGVGVFYRKEFDSFLKDFFKKDKRRSINK